MLLKTRGIILKAMKYSETSLIVDVYTREKGLKKYIVSGVRTSKAKIHANLFQVMSILDLVVYDRPDKDLHRMKEAQSAVIYQRIPFEITRSAIGMFLVEVTRKTIQESESNPELFDFLSQYLLFLDQSNTSTANIHLLFLIQFSAYLGIMPALDYDPQHPFFDLQEGIFVQEVPPHGHYLDQELSFKFHQILECSLEQAAEIKMPTGQRSALLNGLLDYYRLHLDNFPTIHAHTILKEVLS